MDSTSREKAIISSIPSLTDHSLILSVLQVSYILSNALVVYDGGTDLVLLSMDWWKQIFIFSLTFESVNPAQPFTQCLASNL